MKRFLVNVSVSNLADNFRFHSMLFGARPDRVESNDANWMSEDPRIIFAIVQHQAKVGVDHLGLQMVGDRRDVPTAIQ